MLVTDLELACAAAYWGDDAPEFKPTRFLDTDNYKWPRQAETNRRQLTVSSSTS